MKICIIQPNRASVSETFLRDQIENLPGQISLLYGHRPRLAGKHLSLAGRWERTTLKLARWLHRRPLHWEITQLLVRALERIRPHVVLAQYGPTAVRAMDACQLAGVPLVAHFHGYDASHYHTLHRYQAAYRRMFELARSVIAVSPEMKLKLISLGAPAEKVHYNHYGVDFGKLSPARPAVAGPVFVAVGRMVEKKAPQLTIRAFSLVHARMPTAKLRMIGEGPLLDDCRDLTLQLGIADAVVFLGALPRQQVYKELSKARCFVQHSMVARSGDCEGTPVAVIEAAASGLPVISTRHGGIPNVVLHRQSGWLVSEQDVAGMGRCMLAIARDAKLAGRMGAAAAQHAHASFSLQQSIDRLAAILQSAAAGEPHGSTTQRRAS